MNEESVDLKEYMISFYRENPFYIQYVWAGALSKKHMHKMNEDNKWYQQVMGLATSEQKKDYEPAPF